MTYLYVFLVVFAVGSFVLKQTRHTMHALLVLGGILAGVSPFWLSLLRQSDTSLHQMAWMIQKHTPVMNAEVVWGLCLCLFILLGLLGKFISPQISLITFSFLFSGLLCLNQHILSGMYVQPHHYQLYVLPEFTFLTLVLLT